MNAEECTAKLAELDAIIEEIRTRIRMKVEAARALNAENRALLQEKARVDSERRAVQQALIELQVQ